MANKPPKRWPNYAEWHRLEAIAGLQDIQRLSREAHRLMSAGQVVEAVILLGDVRERATAALEELKKAKDGER